MNLLRGYPDLPVVPPGTTFNQPQTDFGVPDLEVGQNSFYRHVEIFKDSSSFRSLKKLLRTADNCLEEAAELCGAEVVTHSWALAEEDEEYKTQSPAPPGLCLVAKVDLIGDLLTDHECPDQLRMVMSGVEKYKSRKGKYYWYDNRIDQYLYQQTPNGIKIWQPDIDVCIRKRKNSLG